MGVFPSSEVKEFWNTNPTKGPIHERLREAISLVRWQQIDRFLHISPPPVRSRNPRNSAQTKSPFEKLEPLYDHLRLLNKRFWATGTHLAVDETIVRFMGRASETVNIPSKPTPEGFKI